ncbi:hypothetical protein MMC29_004530 [Sticta canariensis]|nr:hypothetical protein [Sticta canariensis]
MPPSCHITPKSQLRFDTIWLPVDRHSPTPYPCLQAAVSDLKVSRSPLLEPLPSPTRSSPLTSLRAAVHQLEFFHAPSRPRSSSPRELLALLQLRERLPALGDRDALPPRQCVWYADVAHKVFQDLDDALFEGRLTGNVCLTWTTADEVDENDVDGETIMKGRPAMTCAPRTWTVAGGGHGRRVLIRLNANVLLLDARRSLTHLISVLVDAMLHAYLILVTGHVYDRRPNRHHHEDDGLGELITRAMAAVNGTLRRTTGFETGLTLYN